MHEDTGASTEDGNKPTSESTSGTEVGLELLGLSPQQIERALAERRRANAVGILDQIRAGVAGGDQDAS